MDIEYHYSMAELLAEKAALKAQVKALRKQHNILLKACKLAQNTRGWKKGFINQQAVRLIDKIISEKFNF